MEVDRKSVWLDDNGMPAEPPEGRPDEMMAEIAPSGEEGLFRLAIHKPGQDPLVFEKLEPFELHRTLYHHDILTMGRWETDQALSRIGLEGGSDAIYKRAESRMPGQFIGYFKVVTARHCYDYFRLYVGEEGTDDFLVFVLPSRPDFFDGTDLDDLWDYKPAKYLITFGSREAAIEWAYDKFETDANWDVKRIVPAARPEDGERRNG